MEGNYTRGLQLYQLNRYRDAVKYFKEALSHDSSDFYAKFYLGLCYYHLNELNKVKSIAEALIASHPDDGDSHYLLSMYYYTSEKYEEALQSIMTSITIFPYNPAYFGFQSLTFIALRKYEDALHAANEGLKIDAKNVLCLNSRTKALTKLNRKEEAYNTIENTLSDNPEDYFTQANAGWTNLELGNYKQANIHFKEALQRDPNDNYARQGALEAIKAKNIVYRYFLKYSFWMQKKSSKNQWVFIIGLYILYRLSISISDKMGANFLIPIIGTLYLTFVLGTWIMTPISNSILLFSTLSKYLLSKQDRITAYAFLSIVSIFILSTCLYYVLNNNYNMLFLAIATLCSLIPITNTLQNLKTPFKTFNFWYGIGIFSLGIINLFLITHMSILIPVIMFVLFTWFHGLTSKINGTTK